MKRLAICLFVSTVLGGPVSQALAAGAAAGGNKKSESESAAPAESDTSEAPAAGDTTGELDLSDKGSPELSGPAVKTSATLSWQDIAVLPRKRFLKGGRLEISPFTGTSVNDIMIRHYGFGVDLNYFLSDAISVGVQGIYYVKQLTEREALVGLQYNRIPTLNRNLFAAALNFGYVPAYGKFAWFNHGIMHWEILASAGFGVTKTEIIARDPRDAAFSNMSLTPNVGIGGRFFLFDWLTLNYGVRDYVILDKMESRSRQPGQDAATAKAQADSVMVHNVMFTLGVGMYLPTKFQYKTAR